MRFWRTWLSLVSVPNSRYVPRAFSLEPLNFGRKPQLRWQAEASLSDASLDQLRASQIQHLIAVQIVDQVTFRFDSLVDYADYADVNYARLGRVLRGEIVMRLEDVAKAERTLGLRLIG